MHEIERRIALEVAHETWSAGAVYIGPSSVQLLEFAERFLMRVDEARNVEHEPHDDRLEKWHEEQRRSHEFHEEMRRDAFGDKF